MSNKMKIFLAVNAIITLAEAKDMYLVRAGHWCQSCSAGKYLVKDCEDNKGLSICEKCPENRYMDIPNNETSCHFCKSCAIGMVEAKACSRTSDRVCECRPGKFWHTYLGKTGVCIAHKVCPGEIIANGTPLTDTVCGESTSSSKPHSTNLTSSSPETILSTTDSPPLTTTPSTSIIHVPSDSQHFEAKTGMSTGATVGITIGTILIILILIDVCLYKKKKWGVLWTIKQKLTGTSGGGGDGTRNAEDIENRHSLVTFQNGSPNISESAATIILSPDSHNDIANERRNLVTMTPYSRNDLSTWMS